jgi:hypothetical protein
MPFTALRELIYCFAGRVLEHNWEYMGTARLLAVARSRNRETIYGGPGGWIPVDDDWALRTRAMRRSPTQISLRVNRDDGRRKKNARRLT